MDLVSEDLAAGATRSGALPRIDLDAEPATQHHLPGQRSELRVSSSLNNRLHARGYYDNVPDIVTQIAGTGTRMQTTEVHDHGLLGPVRLIRES